MASTGEATPQTTASSSPSSLVEIPYRTKVLLVAAITVTTFMATMSQTIVATAAQNIVADIGGFDLFPWLFTGFSLAAATAVPIVGKLSDVIGRKPVLLGGTVIFLVASMAAGLSQTMPWLVVFRVFQGLGFAGVMGSTWIIMAAMWPPQDRAKWMGIASAGFTLSGVVGPILGGVISESLTWRWIFLLNLPIGGLALFLIYIWFPRIRREARTQPLDIAGATLFAATSLSLLTAISLGGEHYAWGSTFILGLLGISALSLAAFIAVERRAPDPLLPLGLFRRRVFTLATLASLTITTSFITITAFEPLFVQGVMGKSATASAGPLMTMAVGVALGANLSGQALSRFHRPRETGALGLAVAAVTLYSLSLISTDASLVRLYASTFVLGLGISTGFQTFTVPVQNAMPTSVLGVVTSTLQFSRMFGIAAASAVFGAVLLAHIGANLPDAEPGSPRARIADPEVVVSDERLGEVRDEYLSNPALGEEAYARDLAASREVMADGVRLVFRLASFVVGFGVILAVLAFTGYREPSEGESP